MPNLPADTHWYPQASYILPGHKGVDHRGWKKAESLVVTKQYQLWDQRSLGAQNF